VTTVPRYLLSVFTPADAGDLGPYPSQDAMSESLADTGVFTARLERDGYLVMADGLEPPSTATTVDGRGERPALTDGPYLETKEHLGGFWVVEAPDLDVALELAADGSKACRGPVEVRPFRSAESVAALLGS
jgi:hypothetical protein